MNTISFIFYHYLFDIPGKQVIMDKYLIFQDLYSLMHIIKKSIKKISNVSDSKMIIIEFENILCLRHIPQYLGYWESVEYYLVTIITECKTHF